MTHSLNAQAVQVDLLAGVILTLPDAAGLGVECRSGSVRLAADDDPRDIVLSPMNASWPTHRRALVSALTPVNRRFTGALAMPLFAATTGSPRRAGRPVPHGLAPA